MFQLLSDRLRTLIFLFFMGGLSQSHGDVVIATSGDYAPANMSKEACLNAVGIVQQTREGHAVCGFEVDLLSRICALHQMKCEWTLQDFGWKNSQPEVPTILEHLLKPQKNYDLVVAFLRASEERLRLFNVSGSYFEGHPVLYQSSLTQDKDFPKNAKGFPRPSKKNQKIRIGASGNYALEIVDPHLGYYSKDELAHIEIINVDSLTEQVEMLSRGALDFVFAPNISASSFVMAGHAPFLDVPQMENSIQVGPRVFASRDSRGEELIERVNRGLVDLYQSGEYQKIFDRYHIKKAWGKINGPQLKISNH